MYFYYGIITMLYCMKLELLLYNMGFKVIPRVTDRRKINEYKSRKIRKEHG